jgi:hypothetical protein
VSSLSQQEAAGVSPSADQSLLITSAPGLRVRENVIDARGPDLSAANQNILKEDL